MQVSKYARKCVLVSKSKRLQANTQGKMQVQAEKYNQYVKNISYEYIMFQERIRLDTITITPVLISLGYRYLKTKTID